jgi:threonine aldolase
MQSAAYDVRPKIAVLALENTHNVCGGACLSLAYAEEVRNLAHAYDVRLFVDGARIMNASIAQDVPLKLLAGAADAISMSLNKGLGAPYGGILAGSRETIELARNHLAMFGGHSVHRAGMFAAAALVALEQGPAQIERDHAAARQLAEELSTVNGIEIELSGVQTNLIRVELSNPMLQAADVVASLAALGIGASLCDPHAIRFATHRGFDPAATEAVRVGLEKAVGAHPAVNAKKSTTLSEKERE